MTKKNLFIRMDRIGDLVLTLPMDQYFPGSENLWVITKGLEFLPQNANPSRRFESYPRKFSFSEFKRFLAFLKKEKPDLSVTFHAPWWVNFALWLAKIPKRVGVLSQWHSYLFLNEGLRQKRSQAQKHEAHYNLDLIAKALGKNLNFSEFKPLSLKSSLPDQKLSQWNLQAQKYFVIHPGMGGSALNWPIDFYAETARRLSKNNIVAITGGPMDKAWVEPLKHLLAIEKNILFLDQLKIAELLLILKNAKAVLVPSTGIAHLAASLDAPVVGLYSPIIVERALRWGPLGKKVETLTPKIKEDTKENIDPLVMKEISVDEVCKTLEEISL